MCLSFRWLENAGPAQRAVDILPNLVAFCSAVKNKTITEPTCKSFKDVMKMLGDPLLKTKLEIFISIAKVVEPFLSRYQTDRPMIPFLFDDLGDLMKTLMQKVLKCDIVGTTTSIQNAMLVNLHSSENFVDPSEVKIGFCAKLSILTTKASDRARYTVRLECRDFIKAMLKKLMEKSPVKYNLVQHLSWLQPQIMISKDEKTRKRAAEDLDNTLKTLCDAGRVKSENCDHIIGQYSKICEHLLRVDDNSDFRNFDHKIESHRIDVLFHRNMDKSEFTELWKVVKMILLLSHGQATVERGFSVNKETTADNMKKESLVSRRLVVQAVRAAGGVTSVLVTKELLCYASSACSKYHDHLDQQRKEEAQKQVAQKRKLEEGKIEELKKKLKLVEDDASSLEQAANSRAEEAEKKGKLCLISESNALRKRAQEKRKEASELDKLIKEGQKQMQ